LQKKLKEWRKRKSKCLEIADQISEGRQIKTKEFLEELDMETDEVKDIDINEIGKL
jgi:hypothetical protein